MSRLIALRSVYVQAFNLPHVSAFSATSAAWKCSISRGTHTEQGQDELSVSRESRL